MLKEYIEKLIKQQNLTSKECEQAVEKIINGASPYQTAAFLALMRAKKETSDEIVGIARAMRGNMIKVKVNTPVLDIVGTGGDGAHTINISTGSSIISASCGVKIAKHGNRSVSSKCGSADVLEELGVKIDLNADKVSTCIEKAGIGFCFAPMFHPAMKVLKEIRTGLAIATCFNIMGPLLNPAQAEYLMIGVFNESLVPLVSDVLVKTDIKRAFVFHSSGLDEISCVGPSEIVEIKQGNKSFFTLNPMDYGFNKCTVKDLKGGSPEVNAKYLIDIFNGKPSPAADTLVLNSAVSLYVYGLADSIKDGIDISWKNLKSGKAKYKLEEFIKVSNS